jgi:hypothetical protein
MHVSRHALHGPGPRPGGGAASGRAGPTGRPPPEAHAIHVLKRTYMQIYGCIYAEAAYMHVSRIKLAESCIYE